MSLMSAMFHVTVCHTRFVFLQISGVHRVIALGYTEHCPRWIRRGTSVSLCFIIHVENKAFVPSISLPSTRACTVDEYVQRSRFGTAMGSQDRSLPQ